MIDVGHLRQLDLDLELPASELNAVCTNEQWAEVYTRLVELIQSHRSTLVFVNTRRLAERVAHHLERAAGRGGRRQPSRQPVAARFANRPKSG